MSTKKDDRGRTEFWRRDERGPQVASKRLSESMQRRAFLGGALATGAAVTAVAVGVEAAGEGDAGGWWDDFFRRHYKELDADDKQRLFARIRARTKSERDVDVTVSDPPPLPNVSFAFCLDLNKCNGNRACVAACVRENNQSREPAIQYIKVIEIDRGTMNLERGDLYYEGESVPREDKVYMPVQCNQCNNPPCARACPVEATWKEPDGIVVIDYDWCIGCRYCMAACPYEARHFNFAEPSIPRGEINPNQGYLSNRIRPKGVVEKCHFCLHRTRNGDYPACLEACPTGARKFGNLLDPDSEVSRVIREKRVFVLKEELNTIPQFFYFFG